MLCEVCKNPTRINYGNGSHIICDKCVNTPVGKDLLNDNNNSSASTKQNKLSSDSIDLNNPFVVGILVSMIGLMLGVILENATKISIFVWSIYIFYGIFATSVVLILKEIKKLQK